MTENQNGIKTIASIEKAINVLNIIADSEMGFTATEISHITGSGVSATYHLLNTLKRSNFIYQDPESKKYTIGLGIFRLHALAEKHNTLLSIAQPQLDELRKACDETSNLLILQGKEAVYIAQSVSDHMIKTFTQIGARVPYYCTGGGKVILAYRSKEEREAIANSTDFIPFTKRTISNAPALLSELDTIRAQGFGYDKGEREDGVICIAAPIFNASGNVIAAMSISGPAYRLEGKEIGILTEAVLHSTQAFSEKMGHISQQNQPLLRRCITQ